MEKINETNFEDELIINEEKLKIDEEDEHITKQEDDSKFSLLHDEWDIVKKIKLEQNAEDADFTLQSDSTNIFDSRDKDSKEFTLSDDESGTTKTIKIEDTDFLPLAESDSSSISSYDNEESDIIHFCQHCDFKTKYRGNLKQHQNAKHLGKFVLCQFCGNKFKDRSNLNRHIRLAHVENYRKSLPSYNCVYCDFTTKRKENLRSHMNSLHTLENVFPCEFCSYVGTRTDSYRRHIQAMHETRKKHFKCSRCNFKSLRLDFFKEHWEEKHRKIKLYSCNFCQYEATFSCNLSRHIKRKHS